MRLFSALIARCSLVPLLLGLHVTCLALPRVLVPDIPPYAYRVEGKVQGVAYDLLSEMAHRVGYAGRVELMPPARIAETVRMHADVIAAMAWTPEQEHDFRWLIKLVDEPIVLVADRQSTFDISSLEAARQLRIGVQAGSPGEQLALTRGFNHVEAVHMPEQNARKLALHRIDAWVAHWSMAQLALQQAGLPLDLRRGLVLGSVNGYLATSLRADPAEIGKWMAAVEAMRRDGSYARIVRHYHFTPVND